MTTLNQALRLVCVVALGFIVGPVARAETPYVDPYPEASAGAAFNSHLAQVMQNIEYVYFADGCQVFWQPEYWAQLISTPLAQPLYDEIASTGIRPQIIADSYKKAAQAGRDRAASEGCAYWKDNPEAVRAMRQLARDSRR